MPKVLDISDSESLSDGEDESHGIRKVDGFGFGMASEVAGSTHLGENFASSSGTNLRSSFIGMGFSPSLIDKVIKEKGSSKKKARELAISACVRTCVINTDGDIFLKTIGEEDAGLLLDTLFAYSAHQKSNSESSDSLGPLLDESKFSRSPLGCDAESHLQKALQGTKSVSSDSLDSLLDDDQDVEAIQPVTICAELSPKQDPDAVEDLDGDKRASLLMMNFPVADVDFAINKLGKSAQINELVDFIIAAQIAESENCDDLPNDDHVDGKEDCSTEALFGTMDKTLQLLEMGFNEHEVSLAIEKLGSEVPVIDLANCICAGQMGESYSLNPKNTMVPSKTKRPSQDGSWYHIKGMPSHYGDISTVKAEKLDEDYSSHRSNMGFGDMYGNIKPKEEYYDDFNLDDIKGKRPKEEYEDGLSTFDGYTRKKSRNLTISDNPLPPIKLPGDKYGMPMLNSNGRSIDKVVYGPPYFLYGNVVNLSADGWKKVSQFLYALQPEFVNTQNFSALSRTEGYIHNLPTDNRFYIDPPSPMTILEAIPYTKKWWPSWDTRKQLGCINSDTTETSPLCSSLGKMLVRSRGVLSVEQQTKALYYCRTMNLVWVGPNKLAPLEPENLERILGYPISHTRNPDMTLTERLDSLKNCFQTDTLGYYLSVLRPLCPGGITMLSLYSGIGGAEVTLHRLGIFLKAVVSVESSETRRKVLRRWWQNTDQSGELVQIEGIQKLTSNKVEYLMKKFGGFDLVICQNPCAYAEKGSKVAPGSSEVSGLDFTLFYEFVRVLQRVRTMTGKT